MSGYWDMVKDAVAENREIVKENRQHAAENRKERSDGFLAKLKNLQLLDAETLYDDRIEVKAGTSTLLGEDFSTLYESCRTVSVQAQDADGSVYDMDVLQADCSYPTEMHSAYLRSNTWGEYDTLSMEQKAVYEVTLLSKKYAAMDTSATGSEEEAASGYAGIMAQYRQYCEQNGIAWDGVVQAASTELQLEVSDYHVETKDSLNLYEQVGRNAARSKAQSAEAHNLLLACAPEGYQDQPAPGLDSSLTYEDTCDASYDGSVVAHAAGFFAVVHGVFSAVYDKLPHVGKWAKSVFENLKREGQNFAQNTQALMEEWNQQSDARIQEYQEVAEQFQGIKEDIMDTGPGQAAEDAGDRLSEEIPQMFEDPSQSIQDGRDWLKDKYGQVRPYVDAAGNALESTGNRLKDRADAFVEKWSSQGDPEENAAESENYQP